MNDASASEVDALTVNVECCACMRILHTMLPVSDLTRAIAFYVEALGMELVARKRYDASFENAYLAFEGDRVQIELATSAHTGARDAAAGHLAIGVSQCAEVCARVVAAGGTVTRAPGASAVTETVFAYVRDPDGNALELVERA